MTTTTLKPTVYGVGINDVPGSGARKPNQKAYYHVWCRMLERSYHHNHYPTYAGCTVDPRWHYLSNFKQWYEDQGDVTGKQLDKDIISPNNKVYGPDTCFFVSRQLNMFFTKSDKIRGKYPIGVCYHRGQHSSRKKPYQVQVRNGEGKLKFIGSYYTPEEAYQAFIQAKKGELLERFILPETDQRLKNALMNVYNNMEEYFK